MTDTSRWTDPEFDDSPAAIASRLAARRSAIRKMYDPSEPRDDHGMWTSGGSDSSPRTIPNMLEIDGVMVDTREISAAFEQPVDESELDDPDE